MIMGYSFEIFIVKLEGKCSKIKVTGLQSLFSLRRSPHLDCYIIESCINGKAVTLFLILDN